MKKQVITGLILLSCFCINSVSAVINSNPLLSRGKIVYTSGVNSWILTDNKFGGATWTVSANSWLAVKVGSGYSNIFLTWNNPAYAWSNELSPASCPNSILFPIDYDILVSANSTNGKDGDWFLQDSVRNNIVSARGLLLDFAGYSWVKVKFIKGGGTIDEIEIFDASNGIEDTWFFVGTSISANTFKGTPPVSNYADLIKKAHPGFSPAMVRGGIGCISSSDFANNISKYLLMAGNIHYWAIEMGTNDAWGGSNGNVALFKKNLQLVIDSCKAKGIEPIIAKVLATNQTAAKWQIHSDFQKAVAELTSKNNLNAGPDLYTWFLNHPTELNSDGVHPNATGAASIQRLWTEKMDSLYSFATSVSKVEKQSDFKIFPNPSDGCFEIDSPFAGEILIYSSLGITVLRKDIAIGINSIITRLSPGVYFAKTLSECQQSECKRLIVN